MNDYFKSCKWAKHLYVPDIFSDLSQLEKYPNGLYRCPLCHGSGMIYNRLDDYEANLCKTCFSTGQIPWRIYKQFSI